VFTDFRFIQYFLTNRRNTLLRGKNRQFLQYGTYVTFENAPFLYDEAWNPPEEKKRKKKKKKKVEEAIETEEIPITERGQDRLFDL
jgi:hypothetical protein